MEGNVGGPLRGLVERVLSDLKDMRKQYQPYDESDAVMFEINSSILSDDLCSFDAYERLDNSFGSSDDLESSFHDGRTLRFRLWGYMTFVLSIDYHDCTEEDHLEQITEMIGVLIGILSYSSLASSIDDVARGVIYDNVFVNSPYVLRRFERATEEWIDKRFGKSTDDFTRWSIRSSMTSSKMEVLRAIRVMKPEFQTCTIVDGIIRDVIEGISNGAVKSGALLGLTGGATMIASQTQGSLSSFHTSGMVGSEGSSFNVIESMNTFEDSITMRESSSVRSVSSAMFYRRMHIKSLPKVYSDIVCIMYKNVLKLVPNTEIADSPDQRNDVAILTFEVDSNIVYRYKTVLSDIIMSLPLEEKSHDARLYYELDRGEPMFVLRIKLLGEKGSDVSKDKVRQLVRSIMETKISGIDGITHLQPIYQGRNDGGEDESSFIGIEMSGTNAQELAKVPYIDPNSVVTDYVLGVQRMFGIEMVRDQLIKIMEGQIASPFPRNVRANNHINSLVNTMCCKGHVVPVTKAGFLEIGHEFLSSLSFKDPASDIQRAFLGETDHLRQATAKIMTGTIMVDDD